MSEPIEPSTDPQDEERASSRRARWLVAGLGVLEATLALVLALLVAKVFLAGGWLVHDIAGGGPDAATHRIDLENEPSPGLIAALLTAQSIALCGVAILLGRWRARPLDPGSAVPPVRAIGLGLAAGAVSLLGTIALTVSMEAIGLEVREQAWVVTLAREHPGGLLALAPWMVLLAPFAEELFFRGYMVRFLSQRAGAVAAYAVSSVLFALMHFHLPLLPVYLFYGLFFAYLYLKTSRLLVPVVAHVTVNTTALVILYTTGGQPPA
jgi:membrane protease YdiL (CAAX protease family)